MMDNWDRQLTCQALSTFSMGFSHSSRTGGRDRPRPRREGGAHETVIHRMICIRRGELKVVNLVVQSLLHVPHQIDTR
jgi:hypothetical protein